ncbi:DNA helicase [Solibacillus silvestris]|uniref:DNA helicase n=1 Tax=Solibacillus silvestris TaxID=76853 RepID=UPI003F8083BD
MMTAEKIQKDITTYIEKAIHLLSSQADPKKFEAIIQQNINDKRESSTSTIDFYDRLMLNMAYFVENKMAWTDLVRSAFTAGEVPDVKYIENELMAQQMRIRNSVAEKMDDYKKAFHQQYEELKAEDEDVIYDYAYASVEHALRVDFLTLVCAKKAAILTKGDIEETLKMMDGYMAYYTDQIVNKMTLS